PLDADVDNHLDKHHHPDNEAAALDPSRHDVFRSRIPQLRRIDGIPAAAPHARVPTSVRATELSHLHLFVLGRIAHRAIADVEDVARWLGVPVVVAEALCADLEAAGLLTKALGHR